nr:ISAs1 family transposase [Tepidiphilus olei]
MLEQRARAEKSNEKTAIAQLLITLALEGCIVTIDAMGTQVNITRAIRDRGTHYVLASLKDNQPSLAASVREFVVQYQSALERTPHTVVQTIVKDHGRIETRRCFAFDRFDCLAQPERWPDMTPFVVIESERTINGKTSLERRFYLSSLPADAHCLAQAVRAHWAVENSLSSSAAFSFEVKELCECVGGAGVRHSHVMCNFSSFQIVL